MDRLSATQVVVSLAGDAPIVGGVGNTTFDLSACDRPQNFYMWNSMGMATSIGFGLALARPDLRIVVVEGDGSLLMNLSALATARLAGIQNVVVVVWDNGGWQITGGQPAGTAAGVDLAAIARGSDFEQTRTVSDLQGLRSAFAQAMADDCSWLVVAHVEPGNSAHRPPKNPVALRDRFTAAVAALPTTRSS